LRLECSHCHYIWDYEGKNRFYATCPQCRYKVKKPQETIETQQLFTQPLPEWDRVKLKGVASIVGKVLQKYDYDKESLIQVLLNIQQNFGWLPQEMISEVSRQLEIPYSQVYQIATFYKAFSLAPRGKHFIRVCKGTSCNVRGAQVILEGLERKLGIGRDEMTVDGKFSLETVNCIGCCALGPMMTIDGEYYGKLKLQNLNTILAKYA
jgi:NADH-quinone oxidoreductase subunit E